jgi:hypothetical protein
VRWPRWRLRALVVAVLLITAAGVLYAGAGGSGPTGCATTTTADLMPFSAL